MVIKKISGEEAKNLTGETDWEKVDDLTDADIEKAVKDDADTVLPTNEELKEFKKNDK